MRTFRHPGSVLLLVLVLLAAGPSALAQDAPSPSAIEEQVAVRLVMVEVLVTDRSGRTVPDLGKDDFTLLVDFQPVPIDVLDVTCDAGALDDPIEVHSGELPEPPRSLDPRRFVVALDWMHGNPIDRPGMLAEVRRLIRDRKSPYDEVMIAVIGDGLQIAQPFTRDAATLTTALDAIVLDARIWAQPTFRPLTPRPYFSALSRLMDVLEQYDGAKAVVLMSSWYGASSQDDSWFLEVAHRAAESRTAIYPVSARGLVASRSPGPIGGSLGLARLANESGGMYTRATNDLTLAYARAQRDLACRYTLGFYLDPASESNASRTIRVRMNRGGLQARAPERMSSWTAEDRRRAESLAAYLDPTRLADRSMRIAAQPLEPRSKGRWQTIIAVEHPKPAVRGPDEPAAQIGILISRLGRARRGIDRTARSANGPTGPDAEPGRMVERFDLEPGRWSVTAVLTDPLDDRIRTTTTELVVPNIPEGGPFVTAPVLGTTVATAAPDELESFESLVDDVVQSDQPTAIVSHACRFDPWPERTRFVVQRTVLDADGAEVARLEPKEVDLDGWKALQCRAVLDRLPTSALSTGEYRFEVRLDGEDGHAMSGRSFRVSAPPPG